MLVHFNLSTPLSLSEAVRSSDAFAHPEHLCQCLSTTRLRIKSRDSLLGVPHATRRTVGSSQMQTTCFPFLSNFANSPILPGLWQWCNLRLPFPAGPKLLRQVSARFPLDSQVPCLLNSVRVKMRQGLGRQWVSELDPSIHTAPG